MEHTIIPIAWTVRQRYGVLIIGVGHAYESHDHFTGKTLCGRQIGAYTRWEYSSVDSVEEIGCPTCRKRMTEEKEVMP